MTLPQFAALGGATSPVPPLLVEEARRRVTFTWIRPQSAQIEAQPDGGLAGIPPAA